MLNEASAKLPLAEAEKELEIVDPGSLILGCLAWSFSNQASLLACRKVLRPPMFVFAVVEASIDVEEHSHRCLFWC